MKKLLDAYKAGETDADELIARLSAAPFVELGYATPDLARGLRTGVSEVVYGAGKSAEQIAGIVSALAEAGQERILITRVDAEKAAAAQALLPDELRGRWRYLAEPALATVGEPPAPAEGAYVLVVCAGTSDIYAAEEAAVTAEMLGVSVRRAYDAGVAGLERLLAHADDIQGAAAIVAVAGMEGALEIGRAHV